MAVGWIPPDHLNVSQLTRFLISDHGALFRTIGTDRGLDFSVRLRLWWDGCVR